MQEHCLQELTLALALILTLTLTLILTRTLALILTLTLALTLTLTLALTVTLGEHGVQEGPDLHGLLLRRPQEEVTGGCSCQVGV